MSDHHFGKLQKWRAHRFLQQTVYTVPLRDVTPQADIKGLADCCVAFICAKKWHSHHKWFQFLHSRCHVECSDKMKIKMKHGKRLPCVSSCLCRLLASITSVPLLMQWFVKLNSEVSSLTVGSRCRFNMLNQLKHH